MKLQFFLFLPAFCLGFVEADLPRNFDWRERGAVTKVKDRGNCEHADWAFVATGALETTLFLKSGQLFELSEQDLLDCTKTRGNYGCEGGTVSKALDYVTINGILTEEAYPYKAVDSDTCPNADRVVVKGLNIESASLPFNNESLMKKTLAKNGLLMAVIDGSQKSFLNYSKENGIYQDEKCAKFGKLNVLIVGYGETEKEEKYWIVKNSRGKDWGDEGYIKIAREKNNACGIATDVTFVDFSGHYITSCDDDLPCNFDWRELMAVTAVKNQKECNNTDWAFAAVGALEGQLSKKETLVNLSAQELIDCSKKDSNSGCKGGTVNEAFQYIINNGISTEQSYPYHGIEAATATCLNKLEEKIAKGYNIVFEVINGTSEPTMKEILLTYGPILAIIDSSPDSFRNYKSGIYQDKICAKSGKHNVLIVGYGHTNADSKEKFWIVKNSWGEDWGEEGYIRIAREKNNTCGIATNASYITIAKIMNTLIFL